MRAVLLAVCLVVGAGLAGPAEAITCSPNGLPAFPNPTGSLYGATAPTWQQYFGAKVDVNNGVLCNPTINGVPFNGVPVSNVLPPLSINSGGQLSLTTPLVGTYGGTGVNNGSSTITLGGSLVTGGALTFANLPTANQLLYVSSANNVGYSAIGSGLVLGATTGTNVALVAANNLSDVASAPTARTNLSIAPHVATEAALAAASTATYPSGVWRDDYSAGLGAPPLFYTASGSACSLNAGAGDGGSQVPSADSKCWLAQFPSAGADAREWGVKFDGSTDNSTALAKALAWWALGNHLVLPPATSPALFGTAISVTLGGTSVSATMTGAGSDLSILGYTGASGTGLAVAGDGFGSSVHLRGFTITTNHAGGAKAITLSQGGTISNPAITAPSDITDVTCRGADGYAVADYFTTCLGITSFSNVAIRQFNAFGIPSRPAGTIGIDLEGASTAIGVVYNINSSIVDEFADGIKYGPYVQGVTIAQSNIVGNTNGIFAPSGQLGTDQLTVIGNQFNNIIFDITIDIGNVIITNNLFTIQNTNEVGVDLLDTPISTNVSNNTFQSVSGTNEAGIKVEAASNPGVYSHNTFNGLFIGIWFPAASGSTTSIIAGNTYISTTNLVASGGMQIIPDAATVAFAEITPCSASVEGRTAPIIDSTTATWGSTITGGGTNHVLGYCDASNWTVGAK